METSKKVLPLDCKIRIVYQSDLVVGEGVIQKLKSNAIKKISQCLSLTTSVAIRKVEKNSNIRTQNRKIEVNKKLGQR